MDKYYVATFHSTFQALRFEKDLQGESLAVTMIPVPRVLSSSCGLAARFEEVKWSAINQLLVIGAVDAEEVYLFTPSEKKMQGNRVWVNDSN